MKGDKWNKKIRAVENKKKKSSKISWIKWEKNLINQHKLNLRSAPLFIYNRTVPFPSL
jgi:hypothetical protein